VSGSVYDAHSLVDVGTLLFAVASAYMAGRRGIVDRLTTLETKLARLEGKLDGARVWDGNDRRRGQN
jgi:hypothetical protein